jgi:N6-L-threonylcarbamoyladenine synthase
LDFSFSGIKTGVLYYLKDKHNNNKNDVAASFQDTVIDTLIKKSMLACKIKNTDRLVIGGGVVSNSRLREKFIKEARRKNIQCYFPVRDFCIDNAAMVAGLGYYLFKKRKSSDLSLNVNLN